MVAKYHPKDPPKIVTKKAPCAIMSERNYSSFRIRSFFMGEIIPFPEEAKAKKMVALKGLPDDMAIFLCTGYTDLRQSISGLSYLIDSRYHLNPQSRSICMFCGRRTDRIKFLMYDGNGYIIITKQFDFHHLHWPRCGGKDKGELWWLTQEQFEYVMQGGRIREADLDKEEQLDEPKINTRSHTLFSIMLKNRAIPPHINVRTGYTDLRKSIAGLCNIVSEYGLDPENSKMMYVFCGHRADRIKMLFYDGDGFMLITEHLDYGRFIWPRNGDEMWDITSYQLKLMLEGERIQRKDVPRIVEKRNQRRT